jgi:hypothetical protein
MRLPLLAIVACLVCGLIGFAVGYFYGLAARKRTRQFDESHWENRKPPSAVDE